MSSTEKVYINAQWRPDHFAAPVSPGFQATPLNKRMVPIVPACSFIDVLNPALTVRAADDHRLFLLRSIAQDSEKGTQFFPNEAAWSNPVEDSFQCVHGNTGLIIPLPPHTSPMPPLPGAIWCGTIPSKVVSCVDVLSKRIDKFLKRLLDVLGKDFLSSARFSLLSLGGLLEEAPSLVANVILDVLYDDTFVPLSNFFDALAHPINTYNAANKLARKIFEVAKKLYDDPEKLQQVIDAIKASLMTELAINACDVANELDYMQSMNDDELAKDLGKKLAKSIQDASRILGDIVVAKLMGRGASELGELAQAGKLGARAERFVKLIERINQILEGTYNKIKSKAPFFRPKNKSKQKSRHRPGDAGGVPGSEQVIGCKLIDCIMTMPGKPVNPAYGCKVLSGGMELDFDLPAPLPLPWQRTYVSDFAHTGWLGQGWTTPFSLQIQRQGHGRVFVDEQGRRIELPEPEPGRPYRSRFEQFIFAATPEGGFEITHEGEDVRLCFTALGLPEDADASARAKAWLHVLTRIVDANGNAVELIYGPLPEALRQPGAFEPEQAAALIVPQAIIDSAGRHLRLDFAPVGGGDEPGLPRGLRLTQVVQLTGPRLDPKQAPEPFKQPRVLVRYAYSDAGDLVEVRNALDQVTRQFAYRNHVMVEHRTAGGLISRYEYTEYTPSGKVLRNWLNDGRQWRFEYGVGYTDVTHTTGEVAQGRQRRWLHNENKDFTGHIDELGGRVTRDLDAFGNLMALTDEAGRVTSFTLDTRGLPTQITAPDGSSIRIAYDPQTGKVTQITGPDGATTRHRYDERGNRIETTDALGHRTGYQYDSRGLPTVITDALGRSVRLSYNGAGQLTGHTDCTGQHTAYEYDDYGHLARITDALGQATHYQHDRLGRLLQVREPDGALEQFEYDAAGRLTAHTDALGAVTRYKFDLDDQVTERHNAEGGVLRYEYDGARRLRALYNENAARYDFAWDALDRLAAETGFDGRHTRYRYDPTGLLLATFERGCLSAGERLQQHPRPPTTRGQQDWRSKPTLQNPWGEALAEQDVPLQAPPGQSIITRYQLDPAGRLIAKQVAGHVLQEVDSLQPQYRSTAYAYDQAGRLIEATNDAGARVALSYDALGNLTGESRTGQGLSSRITHQYDALGNRVQTVLPDGRQINWLYYGSGHLHQINIDGQVVSDIERDALYRETGRTQGALVSRYGHDPLGRLTAQAAWRGAAPTEQGRPDAWTALQGPPTAQPTHLPAAVGVPLIGRRYHYDAVGNLTELQDWRTSGTRYQYDKIGRIVQALGPDVQERFAFDPAHNLIKAGQDPVRLNRLEVYEDKRYRYDTHGNLIEKKIGAHTTLRLVWDIEHRLQRVTRSTANQGETQTSVTHYRYDAFGRRLEKKVCPQAESSKKSRAAIKRTLFEWDGNQLLSEQGEGKQTLYLYEPDSFAPLAQVVMPMDPAPGQPEAMQALGPQGEKPAAIALPDEDDIDANIRAFNRQMSALQAAALAKVQSMQGAGGMGALPAADLTPAQMWPDYAGMLPSGWEEPKAQEPPKEVKKQRNWQVYYYHCDHLGTPREVTDEQGAVQWETTYRTWGNTLKVQASGQVQQNLRFQGQYFDEETGWHYNRFRYYDPEVGRFISQDPIGLSGGVNLFAYALNPTGWIDPEGLWGLRRPSSDRDGFWRLARLRELTGCPPAGVTGGGGGREGC